MGLLERPADSCHRNSLECRVTGQLNGHLLAEIAEEGTVKGRLLVPRSAVELIRNARGCRQDSRSELGRKEINEDCTAQLYARNGRGIMYART